jgi:hypothetical protein
VLQGPFARSKYPLSFSFCMFAFVKERSDMEPISDNMF